MAIAAIYKATLLACLLVGVFAQAEQKLAETEAAVPEAEAVILKAVAAPSNVEAAFPEAGKVSSKRLREEEAKLLQEQAANAVYDFATSLVDGIMDNTQHRTESRNGLNVTGSYSYSDGFFRRTVNYIADQFGYRVLSEEIETLGDGPKIDLNGRADVRTTVAGREDIQYTITKDDIGNFNGAAKVVAKE